MRNRGEVLSREQILRAVWGYDYDPGTNVVDVYVGYLRRKLRAAAARRPDRHGAIGRLPVRLDRDALSAVAAAPQIRRLRWRLTAWVAGVMLVSAA